MESEIQAQNIALKTLRQRCEYLQERLTAVEEENCKLKLEKSREPSSNGLQNSSSLEKQIILLNQQKSQLSKQIQIITSENQTLWSQLSKLLPGNDNLGSKLAMTQDLKFKQPANSILNSSNDLYSDCGKESLEEISLKLLNDILMGKTELENQYSQMIDLQRESDILDDNNLSYLSTKIDNRLTLNNMNIYLQKLHEFKQTLCQQKKDLSDAIANVKNLQNIPIINISSNESTQHGNSNLPNCRETNSEEHQDGLPNQNIGATHRRGSSTSDMICPICGQTFTGQFTALYQHVSEHFEDENEEYVDASSTFEVVP